MHVSVLLKEAIDGLNLHPDATYLDGTLGSGGHAEYAMQKVDGNLTVIGLDKDKKAIERTARRLSARADSKIFLKEESYSNLDKVLDELQSEGKIKDAKVDAIVLDLGLSSNQLEESGRGFSFKKDEPLEMTFKESPSELDITAKFILNNWKEETLEAIIFGYGEERHAKRIARAIVEAREVKQIETTFELVDIITKALPKGSLRPWKINPATKTFQAIRIAVNDELNTLKTGLEKAFVRLNKGGRMSVISFHSLEDRIVKNFYKEKATVGDYGDIVAKIITKRPIVPSEEEVSLNPRSRSAKLRIIEKLI